MIISEIRSEIGHYSCDSAKFKAPADFSHHAILLFDIVLKGVQWLSGRVLDSRQTGRGFEPHRRHCVAVLEQDTFILA